MRGERRNAAILDTIRRRLLMEELIPARPGSSTIEGAWPPASSRALSGLQIGPCRFKIDQRRDFAGVSTSSGGQIVQFTQRLGSDNFSDNAQIVSGRTQRVILINSPVARRAVGGLRGLTRAPEVL
jgi:hypothetical protein